MNKISDSSCLCCDVLFFQWLMWFNSQLHNRVLMDETAWILMLQTWLITTKAKSTFTIFCWLSLSSTVKLFSFYRRAKAIYIFLWVCADKWTACAVAVQWAGVRGAAWCSLPSMENKGKLLSYLGTLRSILPLKLKKRMSHILNGQHQNSRKFLITVAYRK